MGFPKDKGRDALCPGRAGLLPRPQVRHDGGDMVRQGGQVDGGPGQSTGCFSVMHVADFCA